MDAKSKPFINNKFYVDSGHKVLKGAKWLKDDKKNFKQSLRNYRTILPTFLNETKIIP